MNELLMSIELIKLAGFAVVAVIGATLGMVMVSALTNLGLQFIIEKIKSIKTK